VMKVLLIKLKNIGDTLLLTPVARAIKEAYPGSLVTVLVRTGTQGILDGCPYIDRVMLSAAPEKKNRTRSLSQDWQNLLEIRAEKYDFVFELTDNDRGRWITSFSGARRRITSAHGWPLHWFFRARFTDLSTQNWQLMHRVEKDYRLVAEYLPLPAEVPPLVFQATDGIDPLVAGQGPYAVVHPVSRWKRKAWPAERWQAVCRHLIDRGLFCVVSSGPDEIEVGLAEEITRDLGPRAVLTRGQRSWAELARLIHGAQLFTGLDTAAMHLASACQCPVVALFGPSIEHHWHPWRSPYEIVSSGGLLHTRYPDFMFDAEKRPMAAIEAAEVIAACDRMLAKHPREAKSA